MYFRPLSFDYPEDAHAVQVEDQLMAGESLMIAPVYVQNAGFGATYGVPIGSLLIERYLKGSIAPERKYIEDNMLNSNTLIFSPKQ